MSGHSPYVGANVSATLSTFRQWLDKTNQIIYDMSTGVVMVSANSSGETTTGNGTISGTFAITTAVVTNSLRGGNVTTSNTLTITSNLTLNTGTTFTVGANTIYNDKALFNGQVTVNNSLVANGAKTFGNINTVSFTENANTSNYGKVVALANTGVLQLKGLTLDDLADANTSGALTDYILKYSGTEWVAAPLSNVASFSADNLTSNTVALKTLGQFGNLSQIGGSGWGFQVVSNTTSNTSSAIFNVDVLTLGSVANTRMSGGANNQFLKQLNSITGTVGFASLTPNDVFAASSNSSIGSSLFFVDRNNNVIGIGTNTITSGNIMEIGGNFKANGVITASGNVVAPLVVANLTGTAANSTLFDGSNSAFYRNADNLNSGTVPSARLPAGNTTTVGVVQLVDSVSNTSTTIAPTAAAVKVAFDAAVTANVNAANASFLSSGTVPTARLTAANTTTVGVTQLVDSVSNTSITTAATPNSVKTAYDAAITANVNAANASFLSSGTVPQARLPVGNSTSVGIVQLVDSVSNTSTTIAATLNSVKTAYDTALSANANAANASFLSSGTVPQARLPATSARVISGASSNTGRISWGTSAPGTLDEGEIYFQY